MNLYLISQSVNNGYDTYDSAVVAARSEEAARNTFPARHYSNWSDASGSWASGPEEVEVELLGVAKPKTKAGVICASFHAG